MLLPLQCRNFFFSFFITFQSFEPFFFVSCLWFAINFAITSSRRNGSFTLKQGVLYIYNLFAKFNLPLKVPFCFYYKHNGANLPKKYGVGAPPKEWGFLMSLAAWQRGWMPTSKCCWVSSLSSLQEESATVTSGGRAGGATTGEWCGVNAQMVSMSQVRSWSAFSPFWNRLCTSVHTSPSPPAHTHLLLNIAVQFN